MSSPATLNKNTPTGVNRSVVSNEIDAVEIVYKGTTYFVEEKTTKVFDGEGQFKGFLGRGEFKEMTLPEDDGVCERCGTTSCEMDEEFEDRELWVSNVDGKNICRSCVWKEDEAEKECDHTGNCGCPCEECGDKAIGTYETQDKSIVPLCLTCKEENDYLMEEEHMETCEEEHCKICSRGVFCDCWDRLCPWCLGNGKEWRMRKDFLVHVKAGIAEEVALEEILVEYA
jgi:hypothetical protein